jgi:hypothetical protein
MEPDDFIRARRAPPVLRAEEKVKKPKCKVAISYRVQRRNSRSRRWVGVGRVHKAWVLALDAMAVVARSFPDVRVVRTTTLVEVL